ncbi:succinylglutamate desuccinylase/aspartoacylase domain-containing protein [Roseateles toxinivorans]|uniref:Succinylglutamate desuccinylase/aspartoacylase family protein n=1 Tax=Roseateles toxinivorans TaxID=270368 RepID=A0A4R6QUG6_9BURK|nr:succinylglutamate desuccinylase/aspartoacylase family protein [Roseateles toxinivorans]TDP74659.1 succinylglutamate desuccinylase/aspartoacylase family protein [Roseateles toxinivorans]
MQATHLRVHQFAGLLPGPRLIVTGAVHGNETCGTRAIERLLQALDSGALRLQRGTLTAIPIVNPLAYQRGQREGERNLNRNLRPAVIAQDFEDRIAQTLCPWLAANDVLLDLHSFNAVGQPFVMLGPRNNSGPLEPFAHEAAEAAMAAALGPTRIVEGWLSTYALGLQRRAERPHHGSSGSRRQSLDQDPHYGVGTTEYMRSQGGYGVTLECGQHDDPNAPEVAWLAITRTLALLGMVDAAEVDLHQPTQAPELLQLYEVVDREHEGDQFAKEWVSFDPIAKGQLIGTRNDGTPVLAPDAGRIVFPNTRAQPGQEWFYLARASERRL